MNTFKKMIFLSNKDNSHNKSMGVLVLEKKNNGTFGTFKTFNYKPQTDLILGIKVDEKIIKQNIILSNNNYNFILNNDFDINKSLGCVLLECDKQNFTPVLWGSEKSNNFKNQIIESLKTNIDKLKKVEIKKTEDNTPKPNTTYEDNNSTTYAPIRSKETYEMHKNPYNINNHVYNPEAYAQISIEEELINSKSEIAQAVNMEALFESDNDEIEKTIDKEILTSNTEHKFYNMIAEQMEELFEKYPRETNLEKIIDNSKWVKINHEEENKYYVVGIIYIDNDIRYVCYGVPGNYYNEPPRELLGYSQWLPTDTLNPYDNGYWVMYQDADTGENIYIK